MQPVKVLQTRHDSAIPLTAGEYLVQQLPNASLVPLESRGHVPHLIAPDEVAEAIMGLLSVRT
jgi:sigma-B regulation protein RsbQ